MVLGKDTGAVSVVVLDNVIIDRAVGAAGGADAAPIFAQVKNVTELKAQPLRSRSRRKRERIVRRVSRVCAPR